MLEKYLGLPGGVTKTYRGSTTRVFSLPNVHGDVFATTNEAGASLTTFTYDPFGNPTNTSSPLTPDNTANSSSFAWAGTHRKTTETSLSLMPTQMGARVYLSVLGRFLQVDPIEGGTANSYVYALDPVNHQDYSGKATCEQLIGKAMCSALGLKNNLTPSGPMPNVLGVKKTQARATITIRLQTPQKQLIPIGKPVPGLKAGDPNEKAITPKRWDWIRAGSSASDYYHVGKAAGATAGCYAGGFLTLEEGGWGCLVGGPAGQWTVGPIAAGVGFILGGLGLPGANTFEGVPDVYTGF